MMIRNAYSTPKGDVLMGAVFTVAQLRAQYTENGGNMTARHRQVLRLHIQPWANGTGLATEFVVRIPKSKADAIPPAIYAALRPHFELETDAWRAANCPWYGTEAAEIDPALIDAELGTELTDNDPWEEP